uniref:histone acetyltransferase n=1 Tax=Pyramimonas obovata TaxID=1411642 RepID=A0A7S0RDS6_9CHLO|mmetsp:Transcript_31740/g.69374  ORF Transcript_31740/g.69374 Transcript_31740/m.69374 type:complete len:456 (+) Transcript_31740:246-1613(+)|eukprot:CAMPEP_0118936018 /NCGR_PEP_ID=MMETSP1169-20130426/15960_1 /TAXON_ID=36882 /ORGANISM="Pyramimonas obovata, Strain CCMP722" /LENGTH=455 /DNA_ID=CAMNT_0006879109 /DNA_START=237 /DNA_END=1604 /DNA_ORIENTATION=-
METDSKKQRVKTESGDVHDGVGQSDDAAPLTTKPEGASKETPTEEKKATKGPTEGESNLQARTPREDPNGRDKEEEEEKADVNALQLSSDLTVVCKREEWFRIEENEPDLVFRSITNSGATQDSIWLVCLKNIFAKQLPNMPKEYIVRLLFDRNHESMLAVKAGVVVGGITFRTFKRQGFAEIAFCAVTASEQVKGYGSRLMNHLKEFSRERHKTTHFLTYADNNAVGYFVKQGFGKEVLLERERWHGYIKDYDGGTLMECALSNVISYSDFPRMIRNQRTALDNKIREFSDSHIVYPGLKFAKGAKRFNPATIPGVLDAGWTPSKPAFAIIRPDNSLSEPTSAQLHTLMREIHASLSDHPDAWPFAEAVDGREVPDYYDIIKDPVDLAMVKRRLSAGEYYITLEMFAADFRRMFENCRIYNAPDTVYYKCATRLEQYFEQKISAGIACSRHFKA